MAETSKILIVDDEPAMRHMLRLVLEKEGYQIEEAGDGDEALQRLDAEVFDTILCDIRMPGRDGRQLLQEVTVRHRPETVIMMSAYGTIDVAIACMKEGAYDYISKPFKSDEVVLALRKAEERRRLQLENRKLRAQVQRDGRRRELIFSSESMSQTVDLVRRAAKVASPVLITGETGTGKELIARLLHEEGGRHDAPFVAVNCSAIPAGLIESELFGHVRGAFTGADRERQGFFAEADGGTLFLDEIGELSLELQPKLLRVLQEGEIRMVGDSRCRRVDVRVVAATARDLSVACKAGRFREDLFYRLAVIEIALPSLRERRDDIVPLTRHFLQRYAAMMKRPCPEPTPAVLARLRQYHWPGNVRELENFIERTLIFSRGTRLDLADLPVPLSCTDAPEVTNLSLPQASAHLEQEYIRKALDACGGNRTRAAALLEISLRGLLYKMKEYGIE